MFNKKRKRIEELEATKAMMELCLIARDALIKQKEKAIEELENKNEELQKQIAELDLKLQKRVVKEVKDKISVKDTQKNEQPKKRVRKTKNKEA